MASTSMLPKSSDDWAPVPAEAGLYKWLRNDDLVTAGFWRCTKSEFPPTPLELPVNETFLVLKGAVRIEVEDGPIYDLSVGDSITLELGTKFIFALQDDFEAFFVSFK